MLSPYNQKYFNTKHLYITAFTKKDFIGDFVQDRHFYEYKFYGDINQVTKHRRNPPHEAASSLFGGSKKPSIAVDRQRMGW